MQRSLKFSIQEIQGSPGVGQWLCPKTQSIGRALIKCHRTTSFSCKLPSSTALLKPKWLGEEEKSLFSFSLFIFEIFYSLWHFAVKLISGPPAPTYLARSGRQKFDRKELEQGQWSVFFLIFTVKQNFVNLNLWLIISFPVHFPNWKPGLNFVFQTCVSSWPAFTLFKFIP